MDSIRNYYLLCTTRLGTKKHIVNELPSKGFETLFTKKEILLFFRKVDGIYTARELIIGSDEAVATGRSVIVV